MNLQRRLQSLEERVSPPQSSVASPARERMREHLDKVAALRRGELDPLEAAEVEAENDAIERRMTEIREDRGERER